MGPRLGPIDGVEIPLRLGVEPALALGRAEVEQLLSWRRGRSAGTGLPEAITR
jgi:hypothetical protein